MGNRILVLRLSSLGDVALTAPVYRNLKTHWPDCRISVLVKPQYCAVLANNPFVDEVIPYRGLRQALRRIRKGAFTHLLDLHSTWRTFWIRNLSGIRTVSVYKKDALARRLYVLFRWSSAALVKHSLDRYLWSLSSWGVPIRFRDLSLGDYGSERPSAPQKAGARVLLVQTSFLGDTLLSLPLTRRIKEVLPGCRLIVVTRPKTADIFRRCQWVDEVIEDDKRRTNAGLRGLLRLSRTLRSKGFDLALVAHRSLRSAIAVWLARIPLRIGFDSSAGSFLFHQTVFFSWGMPELERNLALLLPLKPDLKAERSDSLYLARRRNGHAETAAPETAASRSVQEKLAAAGIRPDDRIVGLHPGSVWKTKRWLPERYARLMVRLSREAGVRLVLIGGEEDRGFLEDIAEQSGVSPLNLAGRTDLFELMDLIGRLSLMITNDSGPMHIAAASGVPTLAIFGPTTRELGFFPYGEGHRVLEARLECRPCGLHGARSCPEGHFLCMRLISVEEAYNSSVELLKMTKDACPVHPTPPRGRDE